jgi:hypothetical protein
MTNVTTYGSNLNGFNRQMVNANSRRTQDAVISRIAKLRAGLAELPSAGPVAVVAGVALRLTLAAVPFAALGWTFINR